jgi:tetratricopeptide (TPR) repeat protein
LKDQRRWAEAGDQLRQAQAIYVKLTDRYPAVPDYRWRLAETYTSLALFFANIGRGLEAEDQCRQSLGLLLRLVADYRNVPSYRYDLAVTQENFGNLLSQMNKALEAEKQFRDALSIVQALVADFKTKSDYAMLLARAHANLAFLQADSKDPTAWVEAEGHFREALAVEKRVLAEVRGMPRYTAEAARFCDGLGQILDKRGKPAQAEEQLHEGLSLREKLVADYPIPVYQVDLGGSYCNYGAHVRDGAQPGESLIWFEKAIRTLTPVYEHDHRDAAAKQYLRNSYSARAKAYERLQSYSEALEDWDKAIEYGSKQGLPGDRVRRAYARVRVGMIEQGMTDIAELSKAFNWLPDICFSMACTCSYASNKSTGKTREYADRAMALLKEAVAKGYKDIQSIKTNADLNPLRERADFKQLLSELEEKVQAKPTNSAPPKSEKP